MSNELKEILKHENKVAAYASTIADILQKRCTRTIIFISDVPTDQVIQAVQRRMDGKLSLAGNYEIVEIKNLEDK